MDGIQGALAARQQRVREGAEERGAGPVVVHHVGAARAHDGREPQRRERIEARTHELEAGRGYADGRELSRERAVAADGRPYVDTGAQERRQEREEVVGAAAARPRGHDREDAHASSHAGRHKSW